MGKDGVIMRKIYLTAEENGKIIMLGTMPLDDSVEIEVEDDFNDLKIFDYKCVDNELVKLTPEEKQELYLELPTEREERMFEQEELLQQVMYEQQKATFLAELPDEEAVKIPLMYGEWNPNGYKYKKGNRFTYNDKFYKVLLDHTSQADWTPDTASSLYVEISDPSVEYPDFKQPTGAHDAYAKGDKITYNGKHYISTMDNNVWSPDSYPQAWQLVE